MAKTVKSPAERRKAASRPDLSRYGEIANPPEFLFPHDGQNGLPIPDYPDPLGLGQKAIDALQMFRYVDGRRAGQRITENTLMPLQVAIIKALFGHVDPNTLTRYLTQVLLLMPRKNSKTWLAAAIALLEMISGREANAEIIMCASTVPQGKLVFAVARNLLETCPELASLCRLQDHMNLISYTGPQGQKARLQVVPTQRPERLHGLSPTLAIVDELHALAGVNGVKAYSALTTGQGARRNPRILICTTMADTTRALQSGEIFSGILERMENVAAGKKEDARALPVLLRPAPDADWRDPQVWHQVNPGVAGGILDAQELAEEYERAEGFPLLESGFRCLRLNMVPEAAAGRRWLSEDSIARNTAMVEWDEFKECDRAYVGVDLAVKDDWTSAVAVGFRSDGTVIARGFHYVCEESFQEHLPADTRWQDLADSKDLMVMPGDGIDLASVASDVIDLWGMVRDTTEEGWENPIVAMDPALGQETTGILEDAYQAQVFHVRQGAVSMTPAIMKLEGLISQDKVRFHPGCIPYALGNAIKSPRGEAMMVVKDAAVSPHKIDPVIGCLVAIALDMAGEAEPEVIDVSTWII